MGEGKKKVDVTPEIRARVIEMLEEGRTQDKIARVIGCAQSTVSVINRDPSRARLNRSRARALERRRLKLIELVDVDGMSLKDAAKKVGMDYHKARRAIQKGGVAILIPHGEPGDDVRRAIACGWDLEAMVEEFERTPNTIRRWIEQEARRLETDEEKRARRRALRSLRRRKEGGS